MGTPIFGENTSITVNRSVNNWRLDLGCVSAWRRVVHVPLGWTGEDPTQQTSRIELRTGDCA